MDDDYHDYMNAVTDEDRQKIQNKYSDKEMFDSMIDWHRINHRKNAYPPIQEQLDMIYRCGLEHWKSEIEDIKSKYPDLTRGYTTRFHEMQKIETTQTQLNENLQTTLADLQTIHTQFDETQSDLQPPKPNWKPPKPNWKQPGPNWKQPKPNWKRPAPNWKPPAPNSEGTSEVPTTNFRTLAPSLRSQT
jgi:hypothetical protein